MLRNHEHGAEDIAQYANAVANPEISNERNLKENSLVLKLSNLEELSSMLLASGSDGLADDYAELKAIAARFQALEGAGERLRKDV